MKKSFQDQLSEFALYRGFDVRKEPNEEATQKLPSRNKLIEKGINKKLQSVIKLAHVGRNGEQVKVEKTVDISAFLKFIIECKQKGEISETDEYFCLCTVENIEDFPPNEIKEFQQVFHSSSSRIKDLFELNILSKEDEEAYFRHLDIIKAQQEKIKKQKEIDRYISLAKKVLFIGIDVEAQISSTPIFNEDDFTLSMGWLDEKLKNEIKNTVHVVLENFGNDYEVGRVLSARAAEKAAKIFYQRCGFQVEDVSINQIKQNIDDEWKYFDLKVNDCPVDVKNSRRSYSNPNRYVEHCVPKFKIALDNENVKIAGVLSNYLWPSALLAPENSDKDTSLLFLGETIEHEQNKLKVEFNSEYFKTDFGRSGHDVKFFFPPWIFNYPYDLYKKRDDAIAELTQQGAMDHVLSQVRDVNLIPLCIVTNVNLTKYWHNESLKTWEWNLYHKLLNLICANGLSLPFLYLTFLSHFTAMLSSHSEQHKDYSPHQYKRFVFMNEDNDKPLGIYDPLYTVKNLIDVLDKLWSADHGIIRDYKYFKLSGFHIFQGKRSQGDKWETIIAYCGGRIDGKGKCGKYPLVLGESHRCTKCKKLICPNCGFCSEVCPDNYTHKMQNSWHMNDQDNVDHKGVYEDSPF